jgi:hypothetical protein
MIGPGTIQHSSRKLLVHTVLSMLVTALGIAGVLYMIFVEDDPAIVPLVLIALGIGWFILARLRLRPRHQ